MGEDLPTIQTGNETFPPIPPSSPADSESQFPRDAPPSKLGEKKEFYNTVKTAAWELANELSTTSNLLVGMYMAQVPKGEIALLAAEAIAPSGESAAAMRMVIKRVAWIVLFYLGIRDDPQGRHRGRAVRRPPARLPGIPRWAIPGGSGHGQTRVVRLGRSLRR